MGDAVFFDFVIQGAGGDAQFAGRIFLDPEAVLECLQDAFFFTIHQEKGDVPSERAVRLFDIWISIILG